MGEISLVVTQAVLNHISDDKDNQSQIAIREPSPEIKSIIAKLTRLTPRILILGGLIKLRAGDTGAIWKAHNTEFIDDFEDLFDLLSRRPGSEMRFLCEFQ